MRIDDLIAGMLIAGAIGVALLAALVLIGLLT